MTTKKRASTAANARSQRVIDWIEEFCCHVEGRWAGHPFELRDWQKDIVREIFGPAGRDGLRTVRQAFIGIPRKNGKSTLGAALALYMLFGDGENAARVFSVAADREQARIVFGIAGEMVRAGKLAKYGTVRRNWIETKTHPQSIYRVLSSDAPTKHGLNPSAVIFDELHAQPDRELWDVLTTGQAARSQPLTVAITTAGFDRKTICWEQYDYGRKVEQRAITDPSFFYRWWGVEDGEQWDDPKVWERVNPNYGESVSASFLAAEAQKAKYQPARQNTFRRLYLNEWTQAESRWLDLGAWDRTAGLVVESGLEGRECCGGLDLAARSDIGALCWDFFDGEVHEVVWRFFTTAENLPELDKRTAGQASVWAREGFLTIDPAPTIQDETILAKIDEDARRFKVRRLAYDPWNASQLAQKLTDNGLEAVPVRQGFASLSAPTKLLEAAVLDGNYRHSGNPVMRWMVDNVVVRQDPAGNIKPDKQKSTEKIDGVVAAVMALDTATRLEPARRSAYADHDVEVV